MTYDIDIQRIVEWILRSFHVSRKVIASVLRQHPIGS